MEPNFYRRLLMEVRPHLARIQHVRESVYLNATNSKLPMKEQQEWMYLYEQMLVDATGDERYRFLPRRATPPPPKEARRDQSADPRNLARPATVPIRG